MHCPPFCPNKECSEHRHTGKPDYTWWAREGAFLSKCAGRIPRFRCKVCGRHFSEATFSVDYYSKKHVDLRRMKDLLTNGSGIRATARQLHVSPTTITRRIMILCRQCLAAHGALTDEAVPNEELVADGFQSFWVSQFHPNNFNLLVGADSQYLYAMTQATLRRAGRMTPHQKRRRARIEAADPPEPGALTDSFQNLLNEGEQLWDRMKADERVLRTDEHQTYTRCLSRCTVEGIRHIRVSSKAPRSVTNPLFAVNYLDREIRKDLAEHHRESVCFARNAALSTARMWIYLVLHNLEKPYRVSPEQRNSHAEVAGITAEKVRRVRRKLYTERAFFSRARLSVPLRVAWMGMIRTPEGENRINVRLTPAYCSA